jgi:hypothetical protein
MKVQLGDESGSENLRFITFPDLLLTPKKPGKSSLNSKVQKLSREVSTEWILLFK